MAYFTAIKITLSRFVIYTVNLSVHKACLDLMTAQGPVNKNNNIFTQVSRLKTEETLTSTYCLRSFSDMRQRVFGFAFTAE